MIKSLNKPHTMKKTLSVIAILFAVISCTAQPGQPKPGKKTAKPTEKVTPKTFEVQYVEVTDTVKVRVICFGEDNQMIWLNGYVITSQAQFANGQKQALKPEVITDDRFGFIKLENVFDVKQFNWK